MSVHGIVDLAKRVTVTRWLRDPDTIEVLIDQRRNYGDELVSGRVLYLPYLDFSAPLAFLIEQVERDRESEAAEVVLHGRTLDGFALGERLSYPPPGESHDTQTAVPAETAMKHFVDGNAGPGAAAERVVPGFAIATDSARGSNVTVAARYQAVLDIVKEIAYASDLGWKVTLDASSGDHVFEVIEPQDLSDSVFLDFDFRTLTEWHEVETLAGSKSVAVVAGQGEGADREIVTRPALEPEGLSRREAFVDARDVPLGDTAVLEQRGDAVLAAATPTTGVTVTAAQGGAFQYPTHYGLGDYVLARDVERGVSVIRQVIGVRFTVEQSAAVPKIEPILDKPDPSAAPSGVRSFSGGRVDIVAGSGGGGSFPGDTILVAGSGTLLDDILTAG